MTLKAEMTAMQDKDLLMEIAGIESNIEEARFELGNDFAEDKEFSARLRAAKAEAKRRGLTEADMVRMLQNYGRTP